MSSPKWRRLTPVLYSLMHEGAIWHLREECRTDGLKVARPGLRIPRFDLGSLATQRDLQRMTLPSGPRFVVFTHKPSMTSVAPAVP